jgi:hypothetical protein
MRAWGRHEAQDAEVVRRSLNRDQVRTKIGGRFVARGAATDADLPGVGSGRLSRRGRRSL